MTFALETLIKEAQRILITRPCDDGDHDWESEGGRACPMGAEGCSQGVYRCRSCGVYDHGEGDDSPGKLDCQSACGDSMMGWRNGQLDQDPEFGMAG